MYNTFIRFPLPVDKLGEIKKMGKSIFIVVVAAVLLVGCFSSKAKNDVENKNTNSNMYRTGAISPQQALEYMKNTDNLLVVDVASKSSFASKHFVGAINIPLADLTEQEAKEMYLALPAGRPVLLHCRRGRTVLSAYPVWKDLRTDIPAIAYIDAAPLFEEYNTWKEQQKR